MAFNGNGNGGRFVHWMSSGLLATVAWFVVLIIYCVFRGFGIEDPLLGQAFLLLTGAWVGNLTLAQSKKTAKLEENAETARATAVEVDKKLDTLIGDAITSKMRADAAERREGEWSQHKNHNPGGET